MKSENLWTVRSAWGRIFIASICDTTLNTIPQDLWDQFPHFPCHTPRSARPWLNIGYKVRTSIRLICHRRNASRTRPAFPCLLEPRTPRSVPIGIPTSAYIALLECTQSKTHIDAGIHNATLHQEHATCAERVYIVREIVSAISDINLGMV